MNKISDRDFVFTGLQPWDTVIGSNAKDIAAEIAKNNRVLYVNTPLDYITYNLKEKSADVLHRIEVINGKKSPIRKIKENLWVLDFPFTIAPVNFLPDGILFDFFNKINNKRIFRYINKIAKQLKFANIIHISDNDVYRSFYAKDFLNHLYSVYYRRDNLLCVPYWRKHALRLERDIIKKSDLVLTNSAYLCKYARKYNTNSYDIGQGVNLSDYSTETINSPAPADIKNIPKPIIGYAGLITTLRLDIELIYQLALNRPDYSFVFVGQEDEIFMSHTLHRLPNIYFLGNKSSNQVPDYIAHFDVCINPQIINDATIGNYPRKIDEYLALGKSVVATKTDTMLLFKDYARLCSNLDNYTQAIDESLNNLEKEETVAKRIKFAHSHSWKNSVNELYKNLLKIEKKINVKS